MASIHPLTDIGRENHGDDRFDGLTENRTVDSAVVLAAYPTLLITCQQFVEQPDVVIFELQQSHADIRRFS
jgi:hypothetical protein